jgi:hypothetical protein
MPLVEGMQFVGRTGRFVPVTTETGGGALYRVKDGKCYAVTGTKGYLWIEASLAKANLEQVEIDYRYFDALINDATKAIEKFGNFEDFCS